MFKKITLSLSILLALAMCVQAEEDMVQHLQDISVTVKSGRSEGSGVIITRELKLNKDSDKKFNVSFIWTAGHVVDGLRTVRTQVDPATGESKKIVEFKDAQIVQELVQHGRKVGEIKMDAKVLAYSDSEDGHDLALLMVRKHNFMGNLNAKFFLKKDIPKVGTRLYHVGSLYGQFGSNSVTDGIISQIGRVLDLGTGGGIVFDQTTVTAFPGSSGGGVYLAENGLYAGMLVRGAGETFNFIVPVRRMSEWAGKIGLGWALDPTKECPTIKELKNWKMKSENFDEDGNVQRTHDDAMKFLIKMNPVVQ